MTDSNHHKLSYSQAANFYPERIGSGGQAAPQQTTLSGKRPRRMRSTQGSAHYGNGHKGKKGPGLNNTKPIEYHDRRTAAPIFLQKTFEMINKCHRDNAHLAGWTDDGKMFVIKDQTVFARDIIPQFFDHSKFTSFARQLNFYGFRKMQSRAIYKGDVNKEAAKYVTFFNEKFQRDRPDLLKEIQRSTKGGQNGNQNQELQKEVDSLKGQVKQLETTIQMMQSDFNHRLAALETQMYQYASYSTGSHAMPYQDQNEEYNTNSKANVEYSTSADNVEQSKSSDEVSRPTLAPHPNSKVLPDSQVLPGPPRQSSMRMESFLRGLSSNSLPEMLPFEQKYFQTILNGPDPVENDGMPSPKNTSNGSSTFPKLGKPVLTRQLSEGIQNLDLSEYPPLSSV